MARMPRPLKFAARAGTPRPGPRGRVSVPGTVLWLGLVALVAGVVLVQLGDSGLPAWRHLKAQDTKLAAEVDDLVKRNEDLRRDLRQIKTDPELLERLARERAGLQKPGEAVLTLVPAGDGNGHDGH